MLAFLLTLLLPSCNRQADPQSILEEAHQTFVHGNLERARRQAEEGARRFSRSNPQIAWKFTLLQADALMWSGESQRVLELLETKSPPISNLQYAVPMLALRAVAYSHLHQFSDAQQSLGQADHICANSEDASCAEVERAWGVLAIERGNPADAHEFFEKTLKLARRHSDRFLEATALLNLGASSLRERHLDEAIDFSNSAYQLASALRAGEIAQTALGNLGWAHYEIGDPDKALSLYLEAINRAIELKDVINHLRWLNDIGRVYLDRHEYGAAQRSYQEALGLANQINSKEDILNAHMELALVSEQTGKLEQANQYAEKAITMAKADGNRLDELYPLLV